MREYKHSKRELTNVVLYLVDSGCKWRQLPHDFPPHFTVHSFYRRALVKVTRKNSGKEENSTYAIIDSQSVKTSYANNQRGFDGGKNKRQKKANSNRYVGLSFGCSRYRTNLVDTTMGIWSAMIASCAYPSIKGYCADKGYRGTFIFDAYALSLLPG